MSSSEETLPVPEIQTSNWDVRSGDTGAYWCVLERPAGADGNQMRRDWIGSGGGVSF